MSELVTMPNGTRLYYNDPDHSYWRCNEDGTRGRRLTGVTTVIKPFSFKPDGLMRWAAKQNGAGIAILATEGLELQDANEIRNRLHWLSSAEAIWTALEQNELTYEKLRDKAAKRGTNVHRLALQHLAETGEPPDMEKMTPEEQGYARGVTEFWLDHSPSPEVVEQIVYSEELGVAGRLDLLAKLGSGASGSGIIDAKTSSWIDEAAHVQVALYAHLSELCGFPKSTWTAILQLKENGSYELIRGQATTDDALAAIEVYRRAGRVGREAKKAWSEAHG